MTIKLPDEALEAIALIKLSFENVVGQLEAHQENVGEHLEAEDQSVVDAAKADFARGLAHLNRQQEPDRFLLMAREVIALAHESEQSPLPRQHKAAEKTRAGVHDRHLATAATYLREQWKADRAELLERLKARLDIADEAVDGAIFRIIEAEFAK